MKKMRPDGIHWQAGLTWEGVSAERSWHGTLTSTAPLPALETARGTLDLSRVEATLPSNHWLYLGSELQARRMSPWGT